jgi:hypothetical protein
VGVVATVRAGLVGPRPRAGVTGGAALLTAVALVVLTGCGSPPQAREADAPASATPPAMSFAVRADRTLVVSGWTPGSCLPQVRMVYAVSPHVLQVLLSDDAKDHCPHAPRPAGHRRPAVHFRIPAAVELDRAAYVDLVGPLATYPRFLLHNALARHAV